jgi:probable phosphoglycerate mutase
VIVFARHGQTAPNRDRQLLGRGDPVLTVEGRAQVELLADTVAGLGPAAVFTSPLVRARETAAAIADRCGLAVVVDELLVEVDYGEWEGRGLGDFDAEQLRRWRTDESFAPPGGESLAGVTGRAAAFCERELDDRVVVAVSHVSPIKGAVTWALGVSPLKAWRMRLDVASLTTIAPGPSLLHFNQVAHLHD